ncbi:MAG: hypothetical protein H6Q33_2431 [Deltaproteobacteria bacterium]|nr:hypothetical protein [Deltaproteobacteria bacterium]
MSKPDHETQLRRGEEQLAAWGVAANAGLDALRAVTGRDAAADLAIAARLGSCADPGSVELLLALEGATRDKLVRKEIRRSLYRLERRGLQAPPVAVKPALVVTAPLLEGYLSAVDGGGDQLVWLAKPRPGGVAHVFAVINDPDGLREVDLSETTRKALRQAREQLLERHELRLVEADWRYCDYVIDRAFRWATEKGKPISGDYPGIRAQLIKQPVTPMAPLILAHLDADAVRLEEQLVAESARLLDEKEFRTWFFDRAALQSYLDEVLDAKRSPLILAPTHQQERAGSVGDRAVEELFGGEKRASWVRRLEEMAYFFYATRRPQQAKSALAVALALDASSHGGREIGFCEQLTRTSLAAFVQMEEQRRAEESKSSLVLTPQEAAEEAQRMRR